MSKGGECGRTSAVRGCYEHYGAEMALQDVCLPEDEEPDL